MPKFEKIALIMGAMKSGTTSLYSDLARHPAIASSRNKETKFFSSDERFARGEDWYHSLYDLKSEHEWVIDGTTDCAKFPYCGDVKARLCTYGAHVKLIYIMRHPVRRMESHARHAARTGYEVNDIRSDRGDHSLDAGPSNAALAISNYALQIDQFRDWFDRGDMALVTTEEYKDDPVRVGERLIDFLGLEPTEDMRLPPQKLNCGNQFIHPRKITAIRNIPALGTILRAVLPKSIRRLGWQNDVLPGRFQFTTEEERALTGAMRHDLDRLRDDYGVDIARWWGL